MHQGFSVLLRTRQLWRFSTGARDVFLMFFLGDPCQQRSWRSLEPPPSWSLKLCGEAAMVTNPNAPKICQQVVQLNSFKPYEDIMVCFHWQNIFGLIKVHSSFSNLETGCSRPSLAAAIFCLALLNASSTVFTLEKRVAELSRSINNFLLSRLPLPFALTPTRNAFAWKVDNYNDI